MTTILVIRGDGKCSETLRDAGFDVLNLELIATKPVEDQSELRSKIAKLADYDGLFFTSPAAAECFVQERSGNNGYRGNVYALGDRARTVLENAGLKVSLKSANSAEELIASFEPSEFVGRKFLFVRGDKSLRTVPERLGSNAIVDEVVVYRTIEVEYDAARIEKVKGRLEISAIEWTCFFSPSGVDAFIKNFGVDAARKTKAAAIGETTERHARERGFNVEFVSKRANSEEMAIDLIEHIRNVS